MSAKMSNPHIQSKAEESLAKLLKHERLLEIDVSYNRAEATLQFRALLDVDKSDFLIVIHEIWDSGRCIHQVSKKVRYDDEVGTEPARLIFHKIHFPQ